MNVSPVGIFDSGVGGLSVALEIRKLLPGEPLVYLADTAYCPYGGRTLEEVRLRSIGAVSELARRGVKAVVVACNTATGAALELLRARFELPIVGLEPAVKPAVAVSRVHRVGVMATAGTLRSERFNRLVQTHANGAEVIAQPCPGLVELVELGETSGERTLSVLMELLGPIRAAGVDTLVLGCTHYPFLREAVAAVMGPTVQLVDSGSAVARQLERVLRERDDLAPAGPGSMSLLTSGEPDSLAPVVERLWGDRVLIEHVSFQSA